MGSGSSRRLDRYGQVHRSAAIGLSRPGIRELDDYHFGRAAASIAAAPLYRMNLLTIGDFYKKRFGRLTEVITTMAIVISYLGWVGAQITALGLVFNVVSNG